MAASGSCWRTCLAGFLENSGEGLGYYIDAASNRWRSSAMAQVGRHWAPHDVTARRPGVQITTIQDIAHGLGWEFEKVERNPSDKAAVLDGRQKLPGCTFDEFVLMAGIEHLESYNHEWNEVISACGLACRGMISTRIAARHFKPSRWLCAGLQSVRVACRLERVCVRRALE